ncbi:transglycosylase domain-containing protein [Thermoflavimicrobium daqui]|uniref:Uncharacterized protein n=1 Tax=Thermoflavimicrobium daqui TaxID=2137476 RepID=A0A364K1C6_9BACL|nr:transglycosylase domain-containing protein [Thermoflavimicrobium daqui]RAL21498.1 hypothetical protein DL897_16215 [Thermoflavimicrobium daqui]
MSEKQKGEEEFVPKVRSVRINETKPPKELPQKVESKKERDKGKSPISSKDKPVPRSKWKLFFTWKWLMLVLVSSLVLMIGMVATIILTGEYLPLERIDESGLIIYDKDQRRIIQLAKEQDPVERERTIYHEFISLEELKTKNKKLIDALIKMEDVRFYKHNGVDFYAMVRSAVSTLTGKREQGGSTITMQVARRVVLGTQERTISRKLKEMAAAWNLEKDKGKEKILEAYLNRIEYGNNIYGVQTAAQVYFGKDLTKDQLTPGEIAILVGLPQGTTTYNPYLGEDNRKRLKKRQLDVLYVMARNDDMPPLITKQEEEFWSKADLPIKDQSSLQVYKERISNLPYLTLIQEEINRKYPHFKGNKLFSSNLKIYTSLDRTIQQKVTEVLKNDRHFVDHQGNPVSAEKVDAGITVLNPKDGSIVAIGGGRQYRAGFQVRAIEKHQPGSTIKPLTVYAPAIETKGFQANSLVLDAPIEVQGKQIHNYEPKYYGMVTLEKMAKWSLNASTVRLLRDEIGLDTAFAYGKKLGLPLVEQDKNYSPLALGGLTEGVSSKDMAQAYAVFPNHGQYYEAHIIRELRVANPNGTEEIIPIQNPAHQVFHPETAWKMTQILKQVIEDPSGTGYQYARLADGREVAGKSGTTQNSEKSWFVGYTPDYVTSVVVFNQGVKKGEDPPLPLSGSGIPAKLFSLIMTEAHQGKPIHPFTQSSASKPEKSTPFGLQAIYEKGRVTLSWPAKGEQIRYTISRSTDGKNFVELAHDIRKTSYVDEVIPPTLWNQIVSYFWPKSITYYYKVTAIDPKSPMQPTSSVVKVSMLGNE